MKILFIIVLQLVLITFSYAQEAISLNEKLRITREILTRQKAKEFLKNVFAKELKIDPKVAENLDVAIPRIRDVSETQFLILLDQNPQMVPDIETYLKQVPKTEEVGFNEEIRKEWQEKFRAMIQADGVIEKFKEKNNPFDPYVISETEGYSNLNIYVNHPRLINRKMIKADSLKEVWKLNIRKAKKEIAINVFDFDLKDIANELIRMQKKGVSIKVGIDKSVIEARHEVKAVFDLLTENKIFVHAVKSVGLNHQKMMAIDWSEKGQGKVLFSSGNLTQSCIGPEGDLFALPKSKRPSFSVPNANHVITFDSDIVASIVAHEISKTVDPGFQLVGEQYPLGGSYKIYSAKTNSENKDYMVLAFSPNGALNSINKNFIAQAIKKTEGPVRMAQFAFSSKTVEEALFKRALISIQNSGSFDFKSVGDTPFAMQDWSGFLSMSGLELIRSEDKKIPPVYKEIVDSKWKKSFSPEAFSDFRKNIRIAPPEYGNHKFQLDDKKVDVSSKIHHKLLIAGDDSKRLTVTGSFNFSKGAESNQEYIVIFKDDKVSIQLLGAIDFLIAYSKSSVAEEAKRRNQSKEIDEPIGPDVDQVKEDQGATK